MDPSMLISDVSSLQRHDTPPKKHSQAEISKALALLGFGSWASLEPSKYDEKDSLRLKFSIYITDYFQFEKC